MASWRRWRRSWVPEIEKAPETWKFVVVQRIAGKSGLQDCKKWQQLKLERRPVLCRMTLGVLRNRQLILSRQGKLECFWANKWVTIRFYPDCQFLDGRNYIVCSSLFPKGSTSSASNMESIQWRVVHWLISSWGWNISGWQVANSMFSFLWAWKNADTKIVNFF